ncbi:predicted protein [Chaetoceros tenuissimus]|uniref:Uncharacterized protein n=1 Tax=Chaetoceros tenuissimus TaxID=426638 RepID=A0AAD3HD22_9STRA|nr:predicted protein [Chaetoceros tenuissimus]
MNDDTIKKEFDVPIIENNTTNENSPDDQKKDAQRDASSEPKQEEISSPATVKEDTEDDTNSPSQPELDFNDDDVALSPPIMPLSILHRPKITKSDAKRSEEGQDLLPQIYTAKPTTKPSRLRSFHTTYSTFTSKPKIAKKTYYSQKSQATPQPVVLTLNDMSEILLRSDQLCNRWDRLGLGKCSGTPALNKYLETKNANETPYKTSEMAHIFETFVAKTESLPRNSVVTNNMIRHPDGDGFVVRREVQNESKDDDSSSLPVKKLARAYEEMTTQGNVVSFKKRQIHRLDERQVVERLMSYENRVCDLKAREEKVLKRLSDLRSNYGL